MITFTPWKMIPFSLHLKMITSRPSKMITFTPWNMITASTLKNYNIQALKNDKIYTRLDVMIFKCRGCYYFSGCKYFHFEGLDVIIFECRGCYHFPWCKCYYFWIPLCYHFWVFRMLPFFMVEMLSFLKAWML